MRTERIGTLVIGGGQAGLAAGYHLKQQGLPFRIVDAGERIGDQWRGRWDSLRLFTPARYDGLPGMRFPSGPHYFPTKDEFADFLEHYAAAFELPVHSGVRVERLTREADRFVATAGERRFEADNVIVAMANYQRGWRPAFAAELADEIVQIHSADYKNPGQLRPGRVLIAGAGNSGSEIAMDVAADHPVCMAGRSTGELPFRPRSLPGRHVFAPLVLRFLFHHVLTVDTPIGRKARPKIVGRGGPLIRVKSRDLAAAGVQRAPRVRGAEDGVPVLEDGRALPVENVVWCTGFRTGFEEWIDLPVHGEHEPTHRRGSAEVHPGLYFLGLHFQRSLSSGMIHGVGRDAKDIARAVAERVSAPAARPKTGAPGRPAAGAAIGA